MRRTMLFLPSNNPNMVGNGGLLGADSLIFDLEDAVAPDQKDAARELLKNALTYLKFGKCEIIVRINGLDTPYWEVPGRGGPFRGPAGQADQGERGDSLRPGPSGQRRESRGH